MVTIKWIEKLESRPHGEFDVRFCREGTQYMKYIMTFILWIEKITGGDIYYNIVMSGGDIKVHCTFSCDEPTLKRIHNRFRTLVRKYYPSNKE